MSETDHASAYRGLGPATDIIFGLRLLQANTDGDVVLYTSEKHSMGAIEMLLNSLWACAHIECD